MNETNNKPTLHLLKVGATPSLDDLKTLFTKLTGREPTDAEVADAEAADE